MERKRLDKLFGLMFLMAWATLAPVQATAAGSSHAPTPGTEAESTVGATDEHEPRCSLDALLPGVPEPVPMLPACPDDRPVCSEDSDCHSFCFKQTGGCRSCGVCSDNCCFCIEV